MTPREDPILAFSTALSIAVILGVLILRLLPLFPVTLWEDTIDTPLSELPHERPKPGLAATRQVGWTDVEIWRAREECMHVLQSVSADVEFLPPIKNDQCRVPAPVRLKGFKSSSELVFDPPVETNCRLMAALYRWSKSTLQPEARRRLGTTVSRIVGASSYACRNVYGRPIGNLSQHAFANAIDIGAFGLRDGRMLTVLKGWGPTARDTREAKEKSKGGLDEVRSQTSGSARDVRSKATYGELVAGQRLAKVSLSTKTSGLENPQQSGAGRIEKEDAFGPSKPTPATQFLRSVHKGACGEFGTVLGPEANDVHRNHFHFDLNPARGRAHCN